MESKKISQLATELSPELSDLTIIGDPTTGISKKITLSQMASLFTGTVEEYANLASFPLVGTADTIYIALDTNIIYRWNTGTSAYVELSPNIVTSLVFNDANGFDGTISLVGSTATLTITTALTQGSIGFIGASGALTQDNSNFFWDNTNKRLGINTNAPTTAIDAFGSGIIGRLNGTSTNNAFLGFASAGSNKWSIGNVQSDHRFRIYSEANAAELVSVLQTGEIGIGIANPLTKLHIFGGASALIANLDANTSVAKSISFRSGNSSRINLEVSGTESGSNAGANFFIRRYSDAGSLIDTPLTITRSTGDIGITSILNLKNYLALEAPNSTNKWSIYTYTDNSFRMNYNGAGNDELIITSNGDATFLNSITSTEGIFSSAGVDGSLGAALRISTTNTNGNARNWVLVNTFENYGDLNFRISNAQGGNALSAGSTIMTLTRSGYLGLGTVTPAELVEISAPAIAGTSQQAKLRITQLGSISARANLVSGVISGNDPYFAIETRESSGSFAIVERLRITGDGYTRLSNSLGIQFNGDTAAANALNDYEEGLYGTSVTTSGSGTITLSTSYDILSYVKVGSIVHVSGLLSVSSVSSPTGAIRIALPFQCANLADAGGTSAANIVVNGTNGVNVSDFVGWVDELTSYIVIYRADGISVTNTSGQQIKANTDFYIQITYRTS